MIFCNFKAKSNKMTTVEIKNKVISKINQLHDDSLLIEIYKLLDIEFEDPEIYRLSDNHKQVLEDAKAQIDRGEYITNQQSEKEIDEWLSK
jgi:hypothetical protein